MSLKYSVIIPTLNEEYFIEKNLRFLNSLNRNLEIIVSDGGSIDNTTAVAKKYNAQVINSDTGRGIQLNTGAKAANGDIFLFLHADTFLPKNAFDLLDEYFTNHENNICRFSLGFDFNHRLLDLYSSLSKYDTPFTRFGDSAVIVRKSFFEKLKGFSNRDIFEDVDFLSRSAKYGRINILNATVNSSARRLIKDGIIERQLYNTLLFIGYIFNINQQTLSKLYNNTISKSETNSIIIFLRFPKLGEVKTRLAKTTSSEFALRFYKSCSENLVKNVKRIPRINRFVFYSNKNEKENVNKWLGNKLFFAPQEGDDLGIRMKNAFEKVFSTGTQKAIIVGTDIPDLSKNIILDAFNSLNNNDVVIGPSKDGGYYLLGIKKMYPELFEDIEYSTSNVFSQTLTRVNRLNLSYHLHTELMDIDTKEDLVEWLSNEGENPIKDEIKLSFNTI